MIPVSLVPLRRFVVWVLAAYAAVLAVGTGQAQQVFTSPQSAAFAQDGRLQVATLRSFVEHEAPTAQEGEWDALAPSGFDLPTPLGAAHSFPEPTSVRVTSSLAPTPNARGPPRQS